MTQLRLAPAIVFVFAVALVMSMTGLLAPHLSAQTQRQQLATYHVPLLPAVHRDLNLYASEY